MQWARCHAEVSSELMKADIEATALNESSILVKWNSGRVCTSILKGYNLTYCQATDDGKCLNSTTTTTVELSREFRNYTIQQLPSYTMVCLSMFMFSDKIGPPTENTCVRTKESGMYSKCQNSLNPEVSESKIISISLLPQHHHHPGM